VRATKLIAVAAAAAVLGGGAYLYLHHAALYPSTDDAYLTANVVHVAPQVAGPVTDVDVRNQQYVTKGTLLYTINPTPYRLAVDAAAANLAHVRQTVAANVAAVASAEAAVHQREVELENARLKNKRAHQLKHNHYVSQQTIDDAEAAYRSAQAALALAKAQLSEAQQQLGQPGNRNEQVKEAQAKLSQAKWNLDHTKVYAACDGTTGQLELQPGDSVSTGNPDFVLICSHDYWVMANYKETDLSRIRVGQPVDISVDMYPGLHLKGKVQSLAGSSGVAFSMLPPENATGNWVKVTQRVPVKIRVLDPDPAHPLRVGTSAVVTINTTVHP